MELIWFSSIKTVFRVVGQALDSGLESWKKKRLWRKWVVNSTQVLELWDQHNPWIPLIPLMSSSSRVEKELVCEILIWDSFSTGLEVCTVSFLREVFRKPNSKQSGSGCQVQWFQCLSSSVSRPSLLKLSIMIEVWLKLPGPEISLL